MKAKRRISSPSANQCGWPWRGISERFMGLGLVSVQLDGYRLHLTQKLRRRDPTLFVNPWTLSLWKSGCLLALPKRLWAHQLRCLQEQAGVLGNAFVEQILTSASAVKADANHRWSIPAELAEVAGL